VNGYLDDLPVDQVGVRAGPADRHARQAFGIARYDPCRKALNDDITGKLKAAIDDYAKSFAA
jgi:F-type H+-transporting ATPase subunit alpha